MARAARPFTSAAIAWQLQRGEALGRVVKIGDGFVQARRGQAGKLLLEAAEGASRLERLLGRGGGIIGARIFDEAIGAPGFAAGIHVPVASIARRNEPERAAVTVRIAGCLRGKMRRNALDVLA